MTILKKLVMVTDNNNNKFINIYPNGDETFTAEWGRVGCASNQTDYPMTKYESYVKSKLKKGYVDITELVTESKQAATWDVEDTFVKELVDALTAAAKKRIEEAYTVAVGSVTQTQIDSAQSIVDELNALHNDHKKATLGQADQLLKRLYTPLEEAYAVAVGPVTQTQIDSAQSVLDELNASYNNHKKSTLDLANQLLKQLYTILPRKMKDTRSYFLKDLNTQFWLELMQSEQSLLQTLTGQVQIGTFDQETLTLSQFNLNIQKATKEDLDRISKETDFRINPKSKIWRVTNTTTDKEFNPKNLTTKLLYHGSRTENYWSILTNGLKIRPTGVATTGSMFGNGIYGADKARKSIGYTSLQGSRWAGGSSSKAYLCLFEFATGNEWNVLGKNGKDGWGSWCSRIDEKEVRSHKKHSVFASAGNDLRMNEYIVYNSNQVTIRYIMEIGK